MEWEVTVKKALSKVVGGGGGGMGSLRNFSKNILHTG